MNPSLPPRMSAVIYARYSTSLRKRQRGKDRIGDRPQMRGQTPAETPAIASLGDTALGRILTEGRQ